MIDAADSQASLEGVLKDEILRMYQEVADNPDGEFHFFHGREGAALLGYDDDLLDRAPAGAVASFAGVGNPHLRASIQAGDTVLDLGSGAGLDAIIASWSTGPTGKVIGIDLNPAMCQKIHAHAADTGAVLECHEGRMEDIPVPSDSVDVVISNGVINLSFQKRRVLEEIFSGTQAGRKHLRFNSPKVWVSITDIVSGKFGTTAERTRFRFRKASTQDAAEAEAYGVKAVMMTAQKAV